MKQYGELKKKLAGAHADDRQTYSDNKNVFIKSVIAKAKKSSKK
jgi:GrpB-like predicted nucleotidyltransferase (UPF0157 family)